MDNISKEIVNRIMDNSYNYNINNEYNKEFALNKEIRYPNLKAYIKSNMDSSSNEYDCDVSEYSITYYKLAWDFLEDGYISNQQNYNKNNSKKEIKISATTFRGDTLNTMKSPFKYYIIMFCYEIYKSSQKNEDRKHLLTTFDNIKLCWGKDKTIDELFNEAAKDEQKFHDFVESIGMMRYKIEKLIENSNCGTIFDEIFSEKNLEKIQYSKEIIDQFENFASLSATIGNQFPCPLYFNSERSNYGKHEYPDLLLEAIYNYYNSSEINEKRSALAKLFISKNIEATEVKSINHCYNWLSYFKDWNSFVVKNFFQDFVEYDNIKKCFGRPKVLWEVNNKEHSLDNLNLPETGKQFIEYLKSINTGIIKRGERIKEKAILRIKKLNLNQ